MATELIPGSEPSRGNDDDARKHADKHAGQSTGKGGSHKRELPDVSDLIDRLDRLAGLAATGLIKPVVVNSMRGCYSDMLRALQQRGDRDANRAGVDDDVLAAIRRNPELGKLLEPFLSADQLDLLMTDAREVNHG